MSVALNSWAFWMCIVAMSCMCMSAGSIIRRCIPVVGASMVFTWMVVGIISAFVAMYHALTIIGYLAQAYMQLVGYVMTATS